MSAQSRRGPSFEPVDFDPFANESGKFADTLKPQVTFRTTTGVDVSGPTVITGTAAAVPMGVLGLTFEVGQVIPLADGIDAVRLFLPKCYLDNTRLETRRLIDCLTHYRKRFNKQTQVFTGTPLHDQYSHGADAARGLAIRHKPPEVKKYVPPQFQFQDPAHPNTAWMG